MRKVDDTIFYSLNKVLFRWVVTLWSFSYLISFFWNYAFYGLLPIAAIIDTVRVHNPVALKSALSRVRSSVLIWAAVLLCIFSGYCWLVLSQGYQSLSFGWPYHHYKTVLLLGFPIRAVLTYLIESAGWCIGYLIIVLSACQTSAGLQPALTLKSDPWVEQAKLFGFFSILFFLQTSSAIITVSPSSQRALGYHPQSDPLQLIMMCLAPIFFAIGIKAWLREVRVFIRQANASEGSDR